MPIIDDFIDTTTAKDLLKSHPLFFKTKWLGYIFCKPVRIGEEVKMEVIEYNVLRKRLPTKYRTIWTRPGVNWFKYGRETFTYPT